MVVKIIDAHVHLLPDNFNSRMRIWLERRLGVTIPLRMDAPSTYLLLREMGVEYIFNLTHAIEPGNTEPLNRWQASLKERYGNIVAFGAFHPETDPSNLYDIFRDFDLDGLKLHPGVQRFHPDSRRALEIYDVLEDLDKPLLIHSGHFIDSGYKYTHPHYYESLVESYTFPVILAHSCYEYFTYLEKFLDIRSNIYADCSLVMIKEEIISSTLGRSVKYYPPSKEIFENFQDRILYGSETPITWWDPTITIKNVLGLNVDEHVKRKILYENARRFMEKYCSETLFG